MKTIHILILAVFVIDAFCLFRKTQTTMTKTGQSEYAQQLLSSINEYRAQNSFQPIIEYNTELEATATQEANNLITYEQFGTHTNFGTLRNQVPNEFLTEIILRVTYSNQLPEVAVFCQQVVEAISQNQNQSKYLTYEYTQGGVALQQDTTTGQYVIVIHLAKQPVQVEEIPKIYESCRDAMLQGYPGNQINATINGQLMTLTCDQVTQGGGWSLILDLQRDLQQDNIIPIDDLGLQYEEILFRAKEGYQFGSTGNNKYQYDGFLFQSNAFRFDDMWFLSEEADPSWEDDRNQISEKQYYNTSNQIEVLVPSQLCYFESENIPSYCAKEFIYKGPLPGRLNAISDAESIAQTTFSNNHWEAYFQIYVR